MTKLTNLQAQNKDQTHKTLGTKLGPSSQNFRYKTMTKLTKLQAKTRTKLLTLTNNAQTTTESPHLNRQQQRTMDGDLTIFQWPKIRPRFCCFNHKKCSARTEAIFFTHILSVDTPCKNQTDLL